MLPVRPNRREPYGRLAAYGRVSPFVVVQDLNGLRGDNFDLGVRRRNFEGSSSIAMNLNQ